MFDPIRDGMWGALSLVAVGVLVAAVLAGLEVLLRSLSHGLRRRDGLVVGGRDPA